MGVMRFLVPRRDSLAPDAVDRAYMAGLDEIPWQARFVWEENELAVERAENDSGNLYIPCPLDGHGKLVLCTASLMERERPYVLHVELARGTLNRLRNQIGVWESMGMQVPPQVRTMVHEASEHLSNAVTRQSDLAAAAEYAVKSLGTSLDAIATLAQSFTGQVLAARYQHGGKINALFGINLGSARPTQEMTDAILPCANTAVVPLSWRDIEVSEGQRDWALPDAQIQWCQAHGLKICGGPLLQIDRWSLPDWMYLWGEDDDEQFRNCVAEHIEAVVGRYRGKVQLWQCAARLNINNDFKQSEEERLRLAVLSVECIRRVDQRTPIILSIDRPWGSYMGRDDYDLSPLQFADALVRAQLGLAGIGLEINFGYTPHGTQPRDMIEFGRQVDRFCSLGLPILISLTAPSAPGDDAAARLKNKVLRYAGGDGPTGQSQRDWAEHYLPMLLAKQPVQGVIWGQLLDSQPHAFGHGGLFDADDLPKPVVELLQSLRQENVV